ncbi:MAG TPA: hypothetical protein VNU93_03980 [Verrucomicrobiae bacterium]|nr:hypothetical protein [Verrucomicrobiae bacterium]
MEIFRIKAEDCLEDLAAIEPVYHRDCGDACYLHLGNAQTGLDARGIRAVKQGLARAKALNYTYLRRLCGEELGRELSVPIPLAANLVLVPVKMRVPLTGNDSAYGLVNLGKVKKVASVHGGGSLVVLESGASLQVLSNRATVLAHLAEGALIRNHFIHKVWGIVHSL